MARDEPGLAFEPPPPPSALHNRWQTAKPILLATAIGLAGALAFFEARLPLPWMLGPMAVVTIAALAGARLAMPRTLRMGATPVIGVMLGSAFTPEVLTRMPEWIVSGSGLALWLIASTGCCYVWFRRVAHYDKATAFFGSTPGGLAEMTLVGAQMGGDVRVIPLIHSIRILIAVFTIPFWYRFVQNVTPVGGGPRSGILDVSLLDYGVLAFCAVVGVLIATRLRMPSGAMMGPMLLSAAFHLTGLTTSQPPFILVAAAQVVIGTMVGVRFVGFPARRVAGIALHAIVTAAIVLTLTVGFAEVLTRITDFPLPALVLSFAPGGLTEMSLMALALQVDTAFVAGHHTLRVVLVTMVAPQIFMALRWWQERRPKA